jgi:type II secretory pathway predicted ATPase ExeA
MTTIGEFGSGKTFTCLSATENLDVRTAYVQTTQALNHRGLVARVGRALEPQTKDAWTKTYDVMQLDLVEILAAQFVLVIIDDAHKLTPTAITELRTLYEHPDTQIALLLIGGPRLRSKLRANDELDDRVDARIMFRRFSDDDAVIALPIFHSFWAAVDCTMIRALNPQLLGRFRRWSAFTRQALKVCEGDGGKLTYEVAADILARQARDREEVARRDREEAA